MIRFIIFLVLLLTFSWFVATHLPQLHESLNLLGQADLRWLVAAGLLDICYYGLFTLIYQYSFKSVGIVRSFRKILPLVLGAITVNTLAPAANTAGAMLFMDEGQTEGHSRIRIVAGITIAFLIDILSFLGLFLVSFIYLFSQGNVTSYYIVLAEVFLVLAVTTTTLMIIGIQAPRVLIIMLGFCAQLTNKMLRLLGQQYTISKEALEKISSEIHQIAHAVRSNNHLVAEALVIGIVSHLVNIACLFVVFLAFGTVPSLSTVVIGYTIGTLFLIVSPTPHGIGVVEGAMTLVFISIGLPVPLATVVPIAFRIFTFWLPFIAGLNGLRRLSSFRFAALWSSDWSVRIIALLLALMGFMNALVSLVPAVHARRDLLRHIIPVFLRQDARIGSIVAGFALFILAQSLWRRKRAAWLVTIFVLLLAAGSHLIKGLDYFEASICVVFAYWLYTLGPYFHSHPDRPNLRRGGITFAAMVAFTMLFGVIGFYIVDRNTHQAFDLNHSFGQTIVIALPFDNSGIIPHGFQITVLVNSLYLLGLITTVYGLFVLVRPALFKKDTSDTEIDEAEKIVKQYGTSTLSPIALLPDKAYFFSKGGSLVAYTVKGRTAVALGDPIGHKEDRMQCIKAFIHFCTLHDWRPVFYQVLPDDLKKYHSMKLRSLCIGQEVIIKANQFSLEGSERKKLRNSYNHVLHKGYSAELLTPPYSATTLARLHRISDTWLLMMNGSEKQFSLGWFDKELISRHPIMIARGPRGFICAFVTLLPVENSKSISVDLMRYLPNVENGTMDFLLVETVNWAKDQGYETFSLGLSPLSGVNPGNSERSVEYLMHYIYRNINQFYNFKGLHAFKAKFTSYQEPRYLVYPTALGLPSVVYAIIEANSGENFMWQYLSRTIL